MTLMRRSLLFGLVLSVAACGDDDAPAGSDTTDVADVPDVSDVPDLTDVADGVDPDTAETSGPDTDTGGDTGEDTAPGDVADTNEPDTTPGERVYDPIPGAWDESFAARLPGLMADLGARAYDAVRDPVSGNLYVGGIFSAIGEDSFLNVAGYHQDEGFFALGEGLDITVHALELGADGALYASGRGAEGGFGLGSPNTISRWRDGAWEALGTTSSFEPVWALLVDGDEVWVGGEFYNVTTADGEQSVEASFLARWDGAAWHAVPGGPNGPVRAIVKHGDEVCVGGGFDQVGEVAMSNVACLGAGGWRAVGDGLNSQVHALLSHSDGSLWAGGYFSFGDPVGPETEFFVGVGRFAGTTWEPVGGGVVKGHITNVWGLAEGPDGGVWVGGDFRQVNAARPVAANNIAKVRDGQWTTFGGVRDDTGNTLLSEGGPRAFVFDGDEVYVAGLFTSVGAEDVQAPGIARLEVGPPAEWSALVTVEGPSLGIAGGINSMAYTAGGELVVAGGFPSAGGTTTPNVARLTEEGWVSLGAGLDDAVWAVHVGQDGAVWAGGRFTGMLGRFDGSAWSFPGPIDGQVRAFAEGGGELYVGGDFSQAGDKPVSRVARVTATGSNFYALGEGLNDRVNALLVDGEGGLYAGGFFTGTGDYDEETGAGAVVRGLGYWNGFAWDEVGGGVEGFVRDLAWYDGKLLVVGQFDKVGDVAASSLALWDGTSWTVVGSAKTWQYSWGSALPLTSVAVQANGFFVAGVFVDHEIDGEFFSGVAWWDGARFHPLGVGTNDLVEDVLVGRDGRSVWAGGFFKTAGGAPALSLSRWLYDDEVGVPVE